MLDDLKNLLGFEAFGVLDALDIALVAVLVYGIVLLLRRTRGAPVAIGILAFFVLYQAVVALELQTLGTILQYATAAMPFVIVLLFQNSIRRALLTLGRNPLFRLFAPTEEEAMIESISLAVLSLSSQGVGAIVAIEREVGLRTYSDSGILVDAKLSYELLLSIFHPRSPLHDGAVIVAHGRIAAASALLPLTNKVHLSVKYGSRHRAAIGLSEETDAIVIVVSEERGSISIAQDGEVRALEAKELRDHLRREMGLETEAPARAAVARA